MCTYHVCGAQACVLNVLLTFFSQLGPLQNFMWHLRLFACCGLGLPQPGDDYHPRAIPFASPRNGRSSRRQCAHFTKNNRRRTESLPSLRCLTGEICVFFYIRCDNHFHSCLSSVLRHFAFFTSFLRFPQLSTVASNIVQASVWRICV